MKILPKKFDPKLLNFQLKQQFVTIIELMLTDVTAESDLFQTR